MFSLVLLVQMENTELLVKLQLLGVLVIVPTPTAKDVLTMVPLLALSVKADLS